MKASLTRLDRENYRILLDNGKEDTFRIPQDLSMQERKQVLLNRLEENAAEIPAMSNGFAVLLII